MKGIAGFTLLELVIVIIVLGILVAVGLPVYTTVIEKARAKVAIEQIGEIQESIVQWAMSRDTISTYTGLTMVAMGYPTATWTPVANSIWNYSLDMGAVARPFIVATKQRAPRAGNTIRYRMGARDTGNSNWPEPGQWNAAAADVHPGQP